MEEFTIHISIDSRLDSYSNFLADGWLNNAPFDSVVKNSLLYQMLDHLGLAWRTTGYVASTPSTVVKVCQNSTLTYATTVTPDGILVAWGEAFLASLSQKVPELVENSPLRTKLMAAFITEADTFRSRASATKPEMPIEPMWEEFVAHHAYAMMTWATQRSSYVAFYNAYEAFLVDALKMVLDKDSLRATDDAFIKGLRQSLDTDVSGPCWGSQEISVAREVRHSLSHGGGKETEKLKKLKHRIRMLERRLQIWPEDNKKLIASLLQGVEAFVRASQSNPRLQAIP